MPNSFFKKITSQFTFAFWTYGTVSAVPNMEISTGWGQTSVAFLAPELLPSGFSHPHSSPTRENIFGRIHLALAPSCTIYTDKLAKTLVCGLWRRGEGRVEDVLGTGDTSGAQLFGKMPQSLSSDPWVSVYSPGLAFLFRGCFSLCIFCIQQQQIFL